MNYFTSDLHLGHRNIIRLCNRPFATIEEMDETLIRNWNAKVTNGDTVYILGDLLFRNEKPAEEYLKQASRSSSRAKSTSSSETTTGTGSRSATSKTSSRA